ncbi:MAG: BamA/TamA family outer membrane protein [Nitrospiraceae bacterium]|nr:BamA/TamA family outer membrane protein [Nitrospiraceae bacterium]
MRRERGSIERTVLCRRDQYPAWVCLRPAGPVVETDPYSVRRFEAAHFQCLILFSRFSAEAKLNGVLFFDYGKGFDDGESVSVFDLRKTAGLEGRWISPFGPLRAAYGINLDPRPGERTGVFEFTIGSIF